MVRVLRRPVIGLGLGLLVVVTLAAAVFPLLWMGSAALKPFAETYKVPPTFLPQQPTFRNFVDLFDLTNFGVYFWNSTKVAVGATLLSILLSSLAGYALSRSDSWSSRLFGRLVLFAYIFPPILMLIPLFIAVTRLGLSDSLAGLGLTYVTFTLPFTLWLLKAYFDAIPHAYEEAAMVDGATPFQAFRLIILPLALPGIISTSMFAFIEAWNEYLYAVVFISTDAKKNLAAGVSSLLGQTAIYSWGMLMAAATVITIPALVFFFLVQRHLIAGFGEGGLKG